MLKRILSTVAIGLLMALSYAVVWWHTARKVTASASERRVLYWVDPMHPAYKSDRPGIAPDCGMRLEPVYADNIDMAPASATLTPQPPGAIGIDANMQALVGIRTATVARSAAPRVIRALGRVAPEDTLVYRIDSGTDGFIRETYNDSVGSRVKKHEKLATCYGPEYLSVASGFLAATAGVTGAVGKDGSRTMPFPGALSKQGVSSLQGYTDRLRNLGMSEVQIKQIAESRQLPESVDIVAPVDGFILARNITPGQHFDRTMEFYRIADLSRVWIVADIFDGEAKNVRPGTAARVTLSGDGTTFTARVTNVLPQVDPTTRTLKLRLEADNPNFALRPDMFVDIELPVSLPPRLTVPEDAVIDSGREQRVFVERADGAFEPRRVQTGWHSGDRVEIIRGLAEGERVVTAGNFLIDSESRMRSSAQVFSTAAPTAPREVSAPKYAKQKMAGASALHDARGGDD